MRVLCRWWLLVAFQCFSWLPIFALAVNAPATSTPAAARPEPPSAPILRVEAGMHTAMINRIDADEGGHLAMTVSDDKTARIWSLPDGRLISTLRVPVGPETEGALYAAALSPDGKSALVTGQTGQAWDGVLCVYLFDVETGSLKGRISNIRGIISHIAYSRDGKRFALAASHGLFLYDNAGKRVGQDLEYKGTVNWVAFDRSGRIATASMDGYVRLYTPDAKLLSQHKLPGEEQAWSVEFSPDDALLAVGSHNALRIEVLSTADLSLKYTPNTKGIGAGNMENVAWLSDPSGSILVAGGRAADEKGEAKIIRVWDKGGQGSPYDITVPGVGVGPIRQIKAVPGMGAVYATVSSWGILQAGKPVKAGKKQHNPAANFRSILKKRFAVSDNGMIVEFADQGKKIYRFDLGSATLSTVSSPDISLTQPVTESKQSLVVSNWENSKPMLNGKPIPMEEEEKARSLAITPDGKKFLLGTDYHLRFMDNQGQDIKTLDMPSAVYGVVISKTGQLAVAALTDGTLHWYGLTEQKPLEELLTFFMDAGSPDRWIAWTPEGFFEHASGSGKDLVGYHMNKGRNTTPGWVGVNQLYGKLHSRAVLIHKISGQPADEEAIKHRIQSNGNLTAFLQEGKLPEATPVEFCYVAQPGNGKETCELIPTAMTMAVKTRGRSRDTATEQASPTQKDKSSVADTQLAGCHLASASHEIQTQGKVQTGSSDVSQPLILCNLPGGSENVKIRYQVVDRGGGIGKALLFLNERSVDEQAVTRGRSRETTPGTSTSEQQGGTLVFEQNIQLRDETTVVGVRFYEKTNSGYGNVKPIKFRVVPSQNPVDAVTKVRGAEKPGPPRMFVLAAGINDYDEGKTGWQPLTFVVPDAVGTVTGLFKNKGNLYKDFLTVQLNKKTQEIEVTDFNGEKEAKDNILSNEQVTKDNLFKALNALLGAVRYNDSVVVYLGGHGMNEAGNFYYIPFNYSCQPTNDCKYSYIDKETKKIVIPDRTPSQIERITQPGFSGPELLESVRKISSKIGTGKMLLIVDTCHGGTFSAALEGMDSLADDSGLYMLAAAGSVQTALDEFPGSGHGLFTYTLLSGLKGIEDDAADDEEERKKSKKKKVAVATLGPYVQQNITLNKSRIKGAADHPQRATYRSAGTQHTFFLAVPKQDE